MKVLHRIALSAGFLALAALPARAQVPTPESVIGFVPGTDRKLADWNQIVDYFRKLDAASGRVKIDGEGKTTLGMPFLSVVITSEANMARLEEIRTANLRLADPRGLSEEEASRLVATGKTIIAHNHGIHASEVTSSQTSMPLAYMLATSQDPRILEILDKTVIVMLPSHNPDGLQMVVDWYRKSLGTPWEGGNLPFLYHHYNGHDNNRDWYMFTQAESQATAAQLYDRWKPQIVHDLHQMGSNAARIFAPPYTSPWEPNVDNSLITATNAIGTYMAARLTSEGKKGVVVNAMYDGFSPARQYPFTHGAVRILTECASAKMATPVDLKFEQLGIGIGYDAKVRSWNFPDPWMGGHWGIGDIMSYQISASLALLEHGAKNGEFWRKTFLDVNRRAVERKDIYAFVASADQKDAMTLAEMIRVLMAGAVEVHRAGAAFSAGGKSYPAGSYVVLMNQPSSHHAKALLERQKYPDLRQYPGGPPQRPYDVTAHTLPLLLNVSVDLIKDKFEAPLTRVTQAVVAPGAVTGVAKGKNSWVAFGHRNSELVAAYQLMKEGVSVRWAKEAFTSGVPATSFEAGTLLASSATPALAAKIASVLAARGVRGTAIAPKVMPPSMALKTPRIGLYQSYVASMDEGWTRFIFDKQIGWTYTTLHDKDVRAGSLRSKFDAIIIPEQGADSLVKGYAKGTIPDENSGGLGEEGVSALKAFVEAGGTLLTFNDASELVEENLGGGVKNSLAHLSSNRRGGGGEVGPRTADFYCPGAMLDAKVDTSNPLAAGMDPRTMVWFEQSPAFDVASGKSVISYDSDNSLLSGWLLGGQLLNRKAALAEIPMGQGRIVAFGFRPQYRAQSWATYIPMLNALLLSAAM